MMNHPEENGNAGPAGAAPADWVAWRRLGLTSELLPIVSDRAAKVSELSKVKEPGKVPSRFNGAGELVGIPRWPQLRSSGHDVEQWAADPRLGICVQCRVVKAFDIDIADPAAAKAVQDLFELGLGVLPVRGRANSGKRLLAFRLAADFPKRIIKTVHGNIELLSTGQQFVACGTHKSGARYEWAGGVPAELPTLSMEEVDTAWQALADAFAIPGGAAEARAPMAIKGRWCAEDCDDPDVPTLLELGLVVDADDNTGKLHVLCPWAGEHTAGGDATATTYMPRGLRGQDHAGFRCLHAHCEGRTIFDFRRAVGLDDPADEFDVVVLTEEQAAENARIAIANAARSAGVTAATRLDRTDAGNVALLAARTGGNLRYVPERSRWIWWTGQAWEPDVYGSRAQAAALEVAEHYLRQARDLRKQGEKSTLDSKEQKRLAQAAEGLEKWAAQCRGKRALDNMLNLAKSDARFTLAVGELDRDPWLFGVANGVVDLRTGALRPAAREDYVTRRSPVRFVPSASAPRWVQFIAEITAKPGQSRPALVSYLHRALGYSMTGQTAEHKMLLAIGQGSNGKNVLLDMLQWVMGDYCQTIPPEALMATRHEGDAERPSPVAATLAGARAAISSESKEGARLDVALVKRHTGGGFMTARYMRENSFRFEITHKLWLMTNNRPALDHMDEAMRGRLHLIPFDMRWNRPGHPERDPQLPDGDKLLPEKLKAEAEGVLAWLVAGAVAYAHDGLEPPAEVVQMTRAYFLDLDPLGRWLEGYEPDPDRGLVASELWAAFTQWQTAEGEEGGPTSQTAFGLALAARGIAKKRSKDGQRYLLRVKGEGL
jgi:P4 family phage/plasmid primase-like protien